MRHGLIRPGRSLPLILALFFLCSVTDFSHAQEAPAAEKTELSQAGMERLLETLEDPQQLKKLKENLRALIAADATESESALIKPRGLVGSLLGAMSGHIGRINEFFAEAGKKMLEIPSLATDLTTRAQDPDILRSWGKMLAKIILVLLAGFLAQLLIIRLLARARDALADKESEKKWRRLLLLAGRTLLELIPIVVFAAAAYGLLILLDPRIGTKLVAMTLINSNVLVRLILTFTRMVLAPEAPAISLLPLDSESLQYLYIWLRRVVRIGVYGYFFLEAALILGLPGSLHLFLLKTIGLVITIMVIIFIMQNRADVAAWLRRERPEADQPLGNAPEDGARPKIRLGVSLRRRLAELWHILAILFSLGIFGTWVLEIEGGLLFVARAVIMTIMIIGLVMFLGRLSRRGIDRLFKISDELKKDHPQLEARANRYLPLLRHTLKGLLSVIGFFSILQVWGLGTLSWLVSPQGGAVVFNLLIIFLIVAGAFLLWEIISVKIEDSLARERQNLANRKSNTRVLTLLPMLRNVTWITLIIVAGMSVLAHLGFNIAPLLAGAGVLGLAVGFGAQTLVKDVIAGAFILLEDSIAVGDWVEAAGHSGTVEHLTIRTMTLRDLAGTVQILPFGEISAIKNYNRDYGYALIDAGVAYREDYGEVVLALQDVATELRNDPTWGPDILDNLEVFGLNNLGDSAVEIRVRIKTLPGRQFSVRRAFLERMKRIFDERAIEIPFPHQTIWFGEDRQGIAPPMRILEEKKDSRPSPADVGPVAKQPEDRPKIQYTSETEASEEVVDELERNEQEQKA